MGAMGGKGTPLRAASTAQLCTDAELVATVADPDVVAELWRRHFTAMVAATRSVAGSDSESVATDSFLATIQALATGSGPIDGRFRAYGCSVARRLARRRSARDTDCLGALSRMTVETASPPAEAEALERLGPDERLLPGWSELAAKWREVLWLTAVEGHTLAQVAERLDMSPNAVAALAFRARRALRGHNDQPVLRPAPAAHKKS